MQAKASRIAVPPFLRAYVEPVAPRRPPASGEAAASSSTEAKTDIPVPGFEDFAKGAPAKEYLSAAILADAQQMTTNLVQWVMNFEEQPKGTRYVLAPSHDYRMPLRYVVNKMWLLYCKLDQPYPNYPSITKIAENGLLDGSVSDLTFMFLLLLNCSSACVSYVRAFTQDMDDGFFLFFLQTVETVMLMFNAHSKRDGRGTTDITKMAYRCPEEVVVAIKQTLDAYT